MREKDFLTVSLFVAWKIVNIWTFKSFRNCEIPKIEKKIEEFPLYFIMETKMIFLASANFFTSLLLYIYFNFIIFLISFCLVS